MLGAFAMDRCILRIVPLGHARRRPRKRWDSSKSRFCEPQSVAFSGEKTLLQLDKWVVITILDTSSISLGKSRPI